MYYSLISYSDVWGNKSSGYEINNQCVEFDDWFIADDCTDKEIVDYLLIFDFFKKIKKSS